MSDIRTGYNNDIRFTLKTTNINSLIIGEPIGWKDDDLELDRHKDYHGIFTKFTNNLQFTNEAKDYIDNAYRYGGINADLFITKETLVDDGTDVVWKVRYSAKADFNTMFKEQTTLSIKFNSNDLAELIKSHESDDFEIETLESIDGDVLDSLSVETTEIKGRSILQTAESKIRNQTILYTTKKYTYQTEIVSRGMDRHSSVDEGVLNNISDATSSHMFYVASTIDVPNANLKVRIEIDSYLVSLDEDDINIDISLYKMDWNGASFDVEEIYNLYHYDNLGYREELTISLEDTYNTIMTKDNALMLVFNGEASYHRISTNKHRLVLSEVEFFESSPNLDCVFNHDLSKRLLYIITGRNDAYYSKYFGRTELGYEEDGDGGLIGVMSGLWARAFDRDSEKYKSLTISLKDSISSNRSVFNTGIGIETVNFKERVREEDLRYFYQNEVAVRLPNQISKVKRTVDKSLFFSGMSFGYEKAGDYEDSMGLDEPNTRTEYVTPIRKSTNKFKKLSKIRTDEYGMELARRKPQLTYPDEDTRYDEGNWFLDLKRTEGDGYEQKDYTDRLQELPSGIHSPETYRSMYFTPLRMLFRHAWVFRSGMEVYLDKFIKYISAVSNSKLTTWAIGDSQPYAENADILVRDLDRSRFLPEIVEFNHPVSDELMEWINGTTAIEYSGSIEEIPNVYFKFEYTNENGNLERGYLLNLKPNKEGKWKMQLSNENIIT